MEAAIWILALLFVAFAGLGAYAGIRLLGVAKRGVDRTVAQARRAVEDTTLRARRYTTPGAAGELAQLRLSLRTSMRATQDALRAPAAGETGLSEAIALFEQLSAHGHELDGELRRMEREPDKARVAARLPELRERMERVTHSADSLRWAARDRALQFADDDLATLGRQIDVEAGALRHWTSGPDWKADSMSGLPESRDVGNGHRPDTWPEREPDAGPGVPEAGSGAPPAQGREPSAITARDPQQRGASFWQKARRPEEST